MPQRPIEHDPDANAVVYVRVRGWAKNACLEAARRSGMTLNAWAADALLSAARDGTRVNTRETPHDTTHHTTRDTTPHDTPTVVDTLASWATGTPLVAPCGKPWPCPASTDTRETAGHHYCAECGVRVTRPGLPGPA